MSLSFVFISYDNTFRVSLYSLARQFAILRRVRQRRRWWWCRCRHSPGPRLRRAMTLAVRRQAGDSHPSWKDLVSPDIISFTQAGWLERTQQPLKFAILAGVDHVFDTTFSRTFSLLESQREFVERFQRKEQDSISLPMMTSACPGIPKEALFEM